MIERAIEIILVNSDHHHTIPHIYTNIWVNITHISNHQLNDNVLTPSEVERGLPQLRGGQDCQAPYQPGLGRMSSHHPGSALGMSQK